MQSQCMRRETFTQNQICLLVRYNLSYKDSYRKCLKSKLVWISDTPNCLVSRNIAIRTSFGFPPLDNDVKIFTKGTIYLVINGHNNVILQENIFTLRPVTHYVFLMIFRVLRLFFIYIPWLQKCFHNQGKQ